VNLNKRDYKILLDTSFLLPFIGFRTDEAVMNSIEKLRGYRVYFSEISILEVLWKIVKKIREASSGEGYSDKNHVVEAVIEGIRVIRRDFNKAEITEKAVREAVKLYLLGHRDLVDNILYSITVTQGDMRFLTIDEKLKDFVKSRNLETRVFIEPADL
jgi:predicted nucleic acid-binding protein